MTKEKRYGVWAGNPTGHKENSENCTEEVRHNWTYSQCSRKKGHGKDKLYCKQHARRYPELNAQK